MSKLGELKEKHEKSNRERLSKQIAILLSDYEQKTGYRIEEIQISRIEHLGPSVETGSIFRYEVKVKVD